ncbi:general transcription repressor [Phlyctochytrium planicorne]|nr:general transcription repressor [Phlyctochytrium planicorne]
MDALRQEIEQVTHDVGMYKLQRDEFEQKLSLQINELSTMQQCVMEIEQMQRRNEQQYQEEIMRLRKEIEGRDAAAAAAHYGQQPPPPQQQQQGSRPPPGHPDGPVPPPVLPSPASGASSAFGNLMAPPNPEHPGYNQPQGDPQHPSKRMRGEDGAIARDGHPNPNYPAGNGAAYRDQPMTPGGFGVPPGHQAKTEPPHHDPYRQPPYGHPSSNYNSAPPGQPMPPQHQQYPPHGHHPSPTPSAAPGQPPPGAPYHGPPGGHYREGPPPQGPPAPGQHMPHAHGGPPPGHGGPPIQPHHGHPPPNQPPSQGAPPPSQAQQAPTPAPQPVTGICEHLADVEGQGWRTESKDWGAVMNPRSYAAMAGVRFKIDQVHALDHRSVVCCVRFSPDGRFLATGSNKKAQVYDVWTGACLHLLETSQDDHHHYPGEVAPKLEDGPASDLYVRSVCFSPDSKNLATGAEDRVVRIYRLPDVPQPNGKGGVPNGSDKGAAAGNGPIVQTTPNVVLRGHGQDIYSLDWSRDGRWIVSGSGDRTVKIWDAETGNAVLTLDNEQDPFGMGVAMVVGGGQDAGAGVTSVAVSPKDNCVITGSLDHVIRLWDIRTGHLLERFIGHTNSVYSVSFFPDGQSIVSGSLDKTLKIWDISSITRSLLSHPPRPGEVPQPITTGTCRHTFAGHRDFVLSVSAATSRSRSGWVVGDPAGRVDPALHDMEWVVSGSKDRMVTFWDARAVNPANNSPDQHVMPVVMMLQGHKNSVISVALAPSNGIFATGSGDKMVCIWKISPVDMRSPPSANRPPPSGPQSGGAPPPRHHGQPPGPPPAQQTAGSGSPQQQSLPPPGQGLPPQQQHHSSPMPQQPPLPPQQQPPPPQPQQPLPPQQPPQQPPSSQALAPPPSSAQSTSVIPSSGAPPPPQSSGSGAGPASASSNPGSAGLPPPPLSARQASPALAGPGAPSAPAGAGQGGSPSTPNPAAAASATSAGPQSGSPSGGLPPAPTSAPPSAAPSTGAGGLPSPTNSANSAGGAAPPPGSSGEAGAVAEGGAEAPPGEGAGPSN